MNQLPLIYHPTTLYWIDDDSLFLNIAADCFKENYAIKTSTSPNEAKNFFDGYQSHIDLSIFLRGCDEHEDYDLTDHLPIDLDFNAIRQVHNSSNKLKDIAVMIVDYRMPDMSGIDLCTQLSTVPTKKILLTGDANFQDAINAFNKGIINYFVCKDDPNIDMILFENVDRLSKEYFIDRTKPIFHHIESDSKLPHSDPVFINFVNKLCKEQNIKEYYLSDKNGGILLVDVNGKLSYLVVHTDRTLNNFVDLHGKDGEATFFVKSVINRNKIPFFGVGKAMWGPEAVSWRDYFYTPKILEGREKYYWILVSL